MPSSAPAPKIADGATHGSIWFLALVCVSAALLFHTHRHMARRAQIDPSAPDDDQGHLLLQSRIVDSAAARPASPAAELDVLIDGILRTGKEQTVDQARISAAIAALQAACACQAHATATDAPDTAKTDIVASTAAVDDLNSVRTLDSRPPLDCSACQDSFEQRPPPPPSEVGLWRR